MEVLQYEWKNPGELRCFTTCQHSSVIAGKILFPEHCAVNGLWMSLIKGTHTDFHNCRYVNWQLCVHETSATRRRQLMAKWFRSNCQESVFSLTISHFKVFSVMSPTGSRTSWCGSFFQAILSGCHPFANHSHAWAIQSLILTSTLSLLILFAWGTPNLQRRILLRIRAFRRWLWLDASERRYLEHAILGRMMGLSEQWLGKVTMGVKHWNLFELKQLWTWRSRC